MIIDFDHNPALTEDQKIQSLAENIQRMYDELIDRFTEIEKQIKELQES